MITGEPDARKAGTSGSEGGRAGKGPARQAPRRAAHPTEFAKDLFGLDQSQVRLYTAILRHTVLTMAALAICSVTAALARTRTDSQAPPPTHPNDQPPDDPGLIPLTVAEIKRLHGLLTYRRHPDDHHLHWSWWRRRHQARARWFHKRTRLRRQHDQSLT